MLQKFLFDRGDNAKPPRNPPKGKGRIRCQYRRPLTKEEKEKRKRARERYERRQAFFFGPRVSRKRSKNYFHLFPDVNDFPGAVEFAKIADKIGTGLSDIPGAEAIDQEVSLIPPEQIAEGAAIIRERCEQVQKTWSPNKLRKRNCFFVPAMEYRPMHDDLRFDNRDGGE